MKISEMLPKLKATKGMYYNLDKSDIIYFQKAYNWLKKYKDKEVLDFYVKQAENLLKSDHMRYIGKIRAIKFLSQHI